MRSPIPAAILAVAAHAAAFAAGPVVIESEIASSAVAASNEFSPEQSVKHLTDGSGLTGEQHDNEGGARTMWHSVVNPTATVPAAGIPAAPAWVRFDFTAPQTVNSIRIWNHNQANCTDRSFRKTRVYGTTDGTGWFKLTSTDTVELPRGGTSAFDVAVATPRPLIAILADGNTTVMPPVAIDNPRVVVSSLKSEPNGLLGTLRPVSVIPGTVTITRPDRRATAVTLPPYGCTGILLK